MWAALHCSETLPQKDLFLEITNIPVAKRASQEHGVALWGLRALPGHPTPLPAEGSFPPCHGAQHQICLCTNFCSRELCSLHLPETPVGRSVL